MEPMLLLRTEMLPDDAERWEYQLKFDGYRAVAFKTGGILHVRSRNDNDFTSRYPAIVQGLAKLPNETVIDGELVVLDEDGRPSFNALQNSDARTPVQYYVFDVMILNGRDVTGETLEVRRQLLQQKVVPTLTEPVRYTGELTASLRDLIHSVKAQGLEGLVAKRRTSRYEPGQRSGAWQKMRVNRGQKFVIGGYTLGTKTFDALIVRVLRGRPPALCRPHPQRVYAGLAPAVVQNIPSAGNLRMPVCEPARGEERPLGTRIDESEDGRMPLAQARAGRAVRVRRMDTGPSPQTLHVRHPSRRQIPA